VDPQLEKELTATLDAANDASDKVRTQHFTFVTFLVYFSLIIASTTDKQLLLISPVNLPLLNVQLPLREFYVIAPWVLVFLHFYLLVQFYLLSQKLHLLKSGFSKISDMDELRSWTNRLSAFSFNHLIINRQHKRTMRFVLAAIIIMTVIVLPLLMLLWAQARFIPYQSEAITWAHRVVILVDASVLWLMWPRIITPTGSLPMIWQLRQLYRLLHSNNSCWWRIFYRWRRRYQKYTRRYGVPVNSLILLVATLSMFVVVIPNGWMEMRVSQAVPTSWLSVDEDRSLVKEEYVNDKLTKKFLEKFILENGVANNRSFVFTHWFFNLPGRPFRQNLFIRNEVLVYGAELPEVKNLLRSEDVSDLKKGLSKIDGLSLQSRNLRYADFRGSILVKVNFGREEKQSTPEAVFSSLGADLRGADLSFANLQGANLEYARLQGANLQENLLQGAILFDALLQGANLYLVQLQGANLTLANLQGANLLGAKLQGADLLLANLQGANLESALLQGANISGANLQGANLTKTNLQGAELDARLQGANISGANLQGANLSNARLQGAVIRKSDFGILNSEAVTKLINEQKEFESENWYVEYVKRLKKAEGKTASSVNDDEAIYCEKYNLSDCDLTQALKVWIAVSCKSLDSAKGIIRYFSAGPMLGPIIKYRAQYDQGIHAKECKLGAEGKAAIIKYLDFYGQNIGIDRTK
jgi:uncharacterized protein YjbI with pentapeptide repeats